MKGATALAALCLGLYLATSAAQDAEQCTCAQDYQPVCGTDDVTYPNQCEAGCANVAVLHAGPCISVELLALVDEVTTEAAAEAVSGTSNSVAKDDNSQLFPGPQRHLQQLDNRNTSCTCPNDYAPVCTTVQTRLNACIANCYYKEAVLYAGECNPTGKPLATNQTSSAFVVVVSSPSLLLLYVLASTLLSI